MQYSLHADKIIHSIQQFPQVICKYNQRSNPQMRLIVPKHNLQCPFPPVTSRNAVSAHIFL